MNGFLNGTVPPILDFGSMERHDKLEGTLFMTVFGFFAFLRIYETLKTRQNQNLSII